MGGPYDPTRPTLERLQREMDESAADLAAGRVRAIGPVLDAVVARATERIEAKANAVKEGQLTPSEEWSSLRFCEAQFGAPALLW